METCPLVDHTDVVWFLSSSFLSHRDVARLRMTCTLLRADLKELYRTLLERDVRRVIDEQRGPLSPSFFLNQTLIRLKVSPKQTILPEVAIKILGRRKRYETVLLDVLGWKERRPGRGTRSCGKRTGVTDLFACCAAMCDNFMVSCRGAERKQSLISSLVQTAVYIPFCNVSLFDSTTCQKVDLLDIPLSPSSLPPTRDDRKASFSSSK